MPFARKSRSRAGCRTRTGGNPAAGLEAGPRGHPCRSSRGCSWTTDRIDEGDVGAPGPPIPSGRPSPITSGPSITSIAPHARRASWTGPTSPTPSAPSPAPRRSSCRCAPTTLDVPYADLYVPGAVAPRPLDRDGVAILFELASGCPPGRSIAARAGRCAATRPAATCTRPRATPSCPRLPGLEAGVYHYVSRDHRLERRCTPDGPAADRLAGLLPAGGVPRRPVVDPLAGGVEVRRAGLPLLPARRRPRPRRGALRGRGAGLVGRLLDPWPTTTSPPCWASTATRTTPGWTRPTANIP